MKALDGILGIACISLFANSPVGSNKVGDYTLNGNVLEYRAIYSARLSHPLLVQMVYELGRKALMFGLNDYSSYWNATDKEVAEVIQKGDVVKARQILDRNKDIFKRILAATDLTDPDFKKRTAEHAFNAFMNGCESIIAKPNDIVGNWKIDGKWTAHALGTEWKTAVKELVKGNKV